MKYTELKEGVHDPHIFKAIFMLGSPGAGKSYIANRIAGGTGMRTVNVDIFYEWLRDNQQILAKGFDDELYKYSGKLTQKQLDLYVMGRLGLILDGTGRKASRLQQTKQMLEELGYDVMAVFVDVDLLVALDRNDERKRRVDPQWLRQVHQDVQTARGTFRSIFGDALVEIDNTSADTLERTLGPVEKRIRNFLAKPPKHPVAQQWIHDSKRSKVSESYGDISPHVVENVKQMLPEIQQNCSEWYREIRGDFALTMYRGLQTMYADIQVKKTHRARVPVDTAPARTEAFNKVITEQGFVANRTNSIFVSGSKRVASKYGAVYCVIPMDGFHYTYSTEYKDWFSTVYSENMSHLGETLRGDDGTLAQAIASGNEIMIHAPRGYYLLPPDHMFVLEQYWNIN